MFNPSQAYEELRGDSLNGRELEASLLVRAACELNKCAQRWPERHSKDFQDKLDEALRLNQKLWTLLQVELSNPENPLPQALRTNLLRLSRYIDQKIFLLFSGGDLQDLQTLSRINSEIAAGLLASPEKLEPDDAVCQSSADPRKVDITA